MEASNVFSVNVAGKQILCVRVPRNSLTLAMNITD